MLASGKRNLPRAALVALALVLFFSHTLQASQTLIDLAPGDRRVVTCPTRLEVTVRDGQAELRCLGSPAIIGFEGVEEGQVVSGAIDIEALVYGEHIDEVVFALDGPKRARHAEQHAPYFFMGDETGDPRGWDTTRFPDGEYTLTATVSDQQGGSGSHSVRFSIGNQHHAAHPMGCAPDELFIDAQAWWSTTPGEVGQDGRPGDDFGHLHTSLCFPHKRMVSGELTLKVRSVMHNNPGKFYAIHIGIFGPELHVRCASEALACLKFDPPRTCPPRKTCTWDDTLTIDTRDFALDGWHQVRVRGFVREPDGRSMKTSTGLHVYINNGRKVRHGYEDPDVVEGRGWYTGPNYANANIEEPPLGPVKGVWEPYVQMVRGFEGFPVTGHYAALDTDFHNGNPGTPLKQGRGSFRGRLRIDTTRLSNGWHRLFLKTDAFDPVTGSTNSGVIAILFEVKN